MDPLAVYQVTSEAVRRARNPSEEDGDERIGRATRPTLIEPVMYRLGPHTTVDDPSVYRDDEDVERWEKKDPIPRMERFLRDRDLLDDEQIDAIETEIEAEVSDLIDRAEVYEADPTDMFEHTYDEATPRISEQREDFEGLRDRHGDDELTRDE
jgi:pyruvate dehydrogenase E1 component alpha subunit